MREPIYLEGAFDNPESIDATSQGGHSGMLLLL
jgi:hypothetical protein